MIGGRVLKLRRAESMENWRYAQTDGFRIAGPDD